MICPSRDLNFGDSIPEEELDQAAGVDRMAERALAPIGATPAEGSRDAADPGRSAAACSEAIRRPAEAAALSLRQLQCRCGSLSSAPQTPASRPFTWVLQKSSPRPGSMSRIQKISMPG